MTNLSKDICRLMAEARRQRGLTQSVLAQRVGCRQNALSMFEAGQPTKLSDEVVHKLSEELGVPLTVEKVPEESPIVPVRVEPVVHGFCPDCRCPTNLPFLVTTRLLFKPNRMMSSPTGGTHCAYCGELLEMRCPNCGATLNDGACCASCGMPYVTNTLDASIDVHTWLKTRLDELKSVR